MGKERIVLLHSNSWNLSCIQKCKSLTKNCFQPALHTSFFSFLKGSIFGTFPKTVKGYCLFQRKCARSVETASLCDLKRSLKDPINVSRESHNSGLASAASLSLHTHSDHIESRCWVGVPRVGCAECGQPPGL